MDEAAAVHGGHDLGASARDLGLVVATAAADELDAVVLELAERMALVGRDLLVANKRVVNMGVELMGRSQLQRFVALNDAMGHQAPEALAFSKRIADVGLRQAIRERDANSTRHPSPKAEGRRSSMWSDVGERCLRDPERPQSATQAEKGRQTDGQVEHLDVGERATQTLDERIVDTGVGCRKQLGVLDGQPLLLRHA